MTKIDLVHPTKGATIDAYLLRQVVECMLKIEQGQPSYLRVQLANNGGLVPVLTVEPDHGQAAHVANASVRYYDPCEGFEVTSEAIGLRQYIHKQVDKGVMARCSATEVIGSVVWIASRCSVQHPARPWTRTRASTTLQMARYFLY